MSDPLPPTPPTPPSPPVPPLPPVVSPPESAPLSAQTTGSEVTERQWAVGLHLSGLLGLLGCSIPGLNIIGPLVIWLLKRPESAYLDAAGKRVLNFQISYAIYLFVAWTGFALLWWIVIGFLFTPLIAVIAIAWLVLTIVGAIKESNGEAYRFPLVIELLK